MQPFDALSALTNVTSQSVNTQPSDRVLAQRVGRDGDEQAFRALYRRHTPALYQFVLRLMGGSELDADDVMQETWIKALEKLPDFRWEASLRTWLTGIALNVCRGIMRRRDRHWMELREDLDVSVQAPRDPERLDLEAALYKLPPGYRTVVVLHDVQGFTHEQIAGQLRVSINTSKSQLSRGRRMLRSLLAPGDEQQVRV